MKAIKIFNIVLAAFLLVSLGFLLGKRYDVIIDSNKSVQVVRQDLNEQKMRKLFNLINKQYIKQVDTDSLIDVTMNYVLQGLDPHSTYLSASKNASLADIDGEANGIGVEFLLDNDTVTILRNLQNSPNKKLFLPGDKLLSINNYDVTGDRANLLPSILENDSNFDLKILRNHKKQEVSVKKSKFHVSNVKSAYMVNPKIGYIKLDHFSNGAAKEVHNQLNKLLQNRAKAIILDLRDNGGGLLNEAIKIADEFIPEDKTIVYLQNEKDKSRTYFKSTPGGLFENGDVYILINENSASASEVVAGSLQDNDIGTIVGRRSFGKGLVQKEVEMNDGSTFRITMAKYYTPSGRSIQKDYSNNSDYNNELTNRIYSGELFDAKKIVKTDSLKKITPKGKAVYGGGGIIPDVFVPLEPLSFDKNFYEKNANEQIKNLIVEEVSTHIPQYYKYKETEFEDLYNAEPLYNKINSTLKKQGINIDASHKKLIETYIKAYIGKILYGDASYYKIWNTQDNMVLKVEEIEKKK